MKIAIAAIGLMFSNDIETRSPTTKDMFIQREITSMIFQIEVK